MRRALYTIAALLVVGVSLFDPAAENPDVGAGVAALLPAGTRVEELALEPRGFLRAPALRVAGGHQVIATARDGREHAYALSPKGEIRARRVWLGTDQLGRDVLWRLLQGAARSLWVALAAAAVSLLFGMLIGVGSAVGPWPLRWVLQWAVDVALALPPLLVLMALIVALRDASWWGTALAVAACSWGELARVTEQSANELRRGVGWLAALAVGVGATRGWLRHLLPGLLVVLGPLSAPIIARAMILEASLAFLGFGPSAQVESWGRLIADGRRFLPGSWVMVIAPGICLVSVAAICSGFARRVLRVGPA
jgi:peptide/nickel transport system permease protein